MKVSPAKLINAVGINVHGNSSFNNMRAAITVVIGLRNNIDSPSPIFMYDADTFREHLHRQSTVHGEYIANI